MIKISDLLDLERTLAKTLFEGLEYPWQVLPEIKQFIILQFVFFIKNLLTII